MLYVNIKKSSSYVQLDFELDANHEVGTTYEDYLSGAWLKLCQRQEEFHNNNPLASVKEVLDCELTIPDVPTLDEIRVRKIAELNHYDASDAVNQFYLSTSPIWLDKSTRVGLMNSINIERAAGRVETNLWFNGVSFSFSIEQAIGMLTLLELYALDCYNTTQRHIAAINTMTTQEEIEAYDFSINYPDKLTF